MTCPLVLEAMMKRFVLVSLVTSAFVALAALAASPGIAKDGDAPAAVEAPPKQKSERKRRGSSTPPQAVTAPDARASQRAVCQSQCNLERMSCDQGRNSFRDRADQLQAVQSSCYLAVQGCLSRC
jgi:hypothetical protein